MLSIVEIFNFISGIDNYYHCVYLLFISYILRVGWAKSLKLYDMHSAAENHSYLFNHISYRHKTFP